MTEVTDRTADAPSRRFRPYPKYTDSGVEWLGKIPTHWDIAPVYARYEVALGKMLDAKRVTGESSGRYLRNVDVQWDAVNVDDLPEMDFPPADRDRYLLRSGDLLVCEGGEVGRTAIWGDQLDECFYQKAIHRVRPWSDSEIPRFFYFLMYALAKRGAFTAGGNPNTIDHLTAVQLRHYRAPFPATSEQRAIVTFLDRQTAKIDALVARKERLIELLQEKRTALITRAVTRGLDPNVPMKDSGVEWLGVIPTHWDSARLRVACCSIETGGTPPIDHLDIVEKSRVDWFAPGDFGGDLILRDSARKISQEAVSLRKARLFPAGSVLAVGIGATLGKVGLIEEPASANQQVNVMIPRDGVEPYYLTYVLYVLKDVMTIMANSATLPILNQKQMGGLHVPIPPVIEQREIVSAIARETKWIEAIRSSTKRTINLLNEFRTALISAAVTGKIAVRQAMLR